MENTYVFVYADRVYYDLNNINNIAGNMLAGEIKKGLIGPDDFDKDLFFEAAICEYYDVKFLDIYVNKENGYFVNETRITNPFTLYAPGVYETRDSLESVLLDDTTRARCYEYSTGPVDSPVDNFISKFDQRYIFDNQINTILNYIYEQHPDAVIVIK